jgi:ribosomal protein S18 acetylase RimI-like enzyme
MGLARMSRDDGGHAVPPGELSFRTIELERDAETAVAFRRDSYLCSFGTDEAFGGVAAYLAWLRDRIARQPLGQVHVWRGQQIVGQLEMVVQATTPPRGYINLFYLAPEWRGRGLSAALHQYALEFMRDGGASQVRLSVSPSNARALAYYRKYAWRGLGPRPDDASLLLMELSLDASSSGMR